ncbi:MAG: NAD(P)H-dependent oxidoreductase [Oscillospiraceae bacterium]|nr:NAD(P)H-dependent oxidoreductase [Oscillospiraceae bacterium]
MNVLVLNGSPKGENSITLQSVLYLEKLCEKTKFEYLHVGQRIRAYEKDFTPCAEALARAELILFCYPVYTFLAPAQLHRFIELMKEHGVDLRGKWATQLSTSKHFYDITAHRFIRDNCADLGLRYVRGLSADMEDLLKEAGRREARAFLRRVFWCMKEGVAEPALYEAGGKPAWTGIAPTIPAELPKGSGRVTLVTDLSHDENGRLRAMIDAFIARTDCAVRVIDLAAIRIDGGCLGCFHCAADGSCVYRDGFDRFLREEVQAGDATVYAFTIRDHSMGSRFKLYDDRQFCNGHRTVTMGRPVGYLISGPLDREENLRTLIEARSQVGGNPLAGIATDQRDPDAELEALAKRLSYALNTDARQPANFYGVGGMKIFRDLIWQMQGLMREDHRFYKAHGFYDFPQKQRGKMAAMYLVGGMMKNKKLSRKLGGKMTEGMLMPYRKVLEKAAEQK